MLNPADNSSQPLPCSVIIAARNEELSIGDVVRHARRHAVEVIVVDGHSSDATAARAAEAGAHIYRDDGRGKGAAMRIGAQHATQPLLLFMDADGSHDAADIPRLLKPLLDDAADLVIGSRMRGGSDELSGTFGMFVRLVASQWITLLINWRWKVALTDSQNGFRAIRREVFRSLDLREYGYAMEQEMLMRALKHKARVVEVPTHEYARAHGTSHIRLRRVWLRHAVSLIKGLVF